MIVGNGPDRMYTMAADGSDRHKVRNDGPAWNDDAPDYFPDGTQLVFARCHVDGPAARSTWSGSTAPGCSP